MTVAVTSGSTRNVLFNASLRFLRSPPIPSIPSSKAWLSFQWRASSHLRSLTTTVTNPSKFTWDDVLRVGEAQDSPDDPPALLGYVHKVQKCNRGSELQSEFLPFVMEDQVVGFVHPRIADHLKKFPDVFTLVRNDGHGYNKDNHVTLHSHLKSPEDRTEAVGDVIKILGDNIIPGIRNELYPVTSAFGTPIFFSLERAAAPLFGIKAYGVHMNGYVEKEGQKFLWIGKRSDLKPTFPGMLDHLVAGGLPYGISCKDNLLKECEEEAGIPKSIGDLAVAAGAVSYMDIDECSFKRDVLFCYDLKLPDDFVPSNQDGEVDSFKLIPVTQVANIIRRTDFFKTNCSLVIIDFLVRHGLITPDDFGYLDLLRSLRHGDCS